MPGTTKRLTGTPSSGKKEGRAALAHAHAYAAASAKTSARLKRHFYKRVTTTDITTVMAALVVDADAAQTGSSYYLTSQGLKKAHSSLSPRYTPGTY